MPLVLADRVRETTTTTGTGTVTLGGAAPTGYQTFSAAIGNGNTTYYTISAGAQWEIGLGTYTSSGNTLARTTVLASSNAGALVNFSAGTKDVFVTYPAGKALYYNGSGSAVVSTSDFRVEADANNYFLLTNYGVSGYQLFGENTSFGTYGGSYNNTLYSRGTKASPVKVEAGDYLGGGGYTGNITTGSETFRYGIAWDVVVDAPVTATSCPASVVVYTGSTSGFGERLRLTSAGNVGIGTTAPSGRFNVVATGSTSGFVVDQFTYGGSNTNMYVYTDNYNNGAFGDGFYAHYSRGTKGSPLAVQNGDSIGDFGSGAYDGTEIVYRASVRFTVDGAVSTGTVPTAMRFFTATTGASFAERMRITSAGNVGIGTTAPTARLQVSTTDLSVAKFGHPAGTGWNFEAYAYDTDNINQGTNLVAKSYGTNNERPSIYLTYIRGTPSAPLPNIVGDWLGQYRFMGRGTTQELSPAYMLAEVSSAPSGDFMPTSIAFRVGGNWSAPERMRITSDGNVGIGTTAPNAAAQFDITSTTRGFLPPRMTTTQRDAISSPPNGLMLYNTTTDKLQVRAAGSWVDLH